MTAVLSALAASGPIGVAAAVVLTLVILLLRERRRARRLAARISAVPPASVIPAPPPSRPAWPPRKILIVDDDESMARAMRKWIIGEIENVAIDLASSGEEALERVRVEGFDLLLVDLLMPGMGGVAFVQALREASKKPLAPVVVISGLEPAAIAELARECGANAWIAKDDIDRDRLVAEVQRFLDPGLRQRDSRS